MCFERFFDARLLIVNLLIIEINEGQTPGIGHSVEGGFSKVAADAFNFRTGCRINIRATTGS
jgi:hypothetical protein